MIAFVRGKFARKSPAVIVVDVNGVGYELQVSLNTYSAVADMAEGQLFTYLHITENAHVLYGFFEMAEKELFLNLISVSGVGASTARMMLSGMKPEEIVRAIVQGNARQLEAIKGIGKKTAERLILELRDKLGKQNLDTVMNQPLLAVEQDALYALMALGIAKPAAETALKKVLKISPDATLEEIIKQSLKQM
ncbi:Holliday junction branch migration protein RuvA [Danxiaibacter flavus]|uniref:Holliday junction branch migration complex subunit RuvA n=1 Tax=Danxiaibacter flavus TaxID=3049108 RepID=A0ABV3ZD76_9BACT|nr:Holliday junction branch migration protein RuvA [Chitinophagaceae bacterium DXS]